MPTCVIFNPAARGNKARHFRRYLDGMGGRTAFKATAAPGEARRLAAEAVGDGFNVIVAAGGDGTVNEVLNGIGDANGFARTRFGVLPLGTVNVFARELKIPPRIEYAWEVLQRGREPCNKPRNVLGLYRPACKTRPAIADPSKAAAALAATWTGKKVLREVAGLKKGWLKTINIAGRQYLTQEAINEFHRRAIGGEFAQHHQTPSRKNSSA